MPLYKSLQPDAQTQVSVWKISETEKELHAGIQLKEKSRLRLSGMQSEPHRKGFLSVRQLLRHHQYTDIDLSYDANGKPYLRDGRHISITHSHEFSAIVVSNVAQGIDIEKKREKIIRIAHKFLADGKELESFQGNVSGLTWAWCAKETIYKIAPPVGISFKQHLRVKFEEFVPNRMQGRLLFEGEEAHYQIDGFELDGFVLTYGKEINPLTQV